MNKTPTLPTVLLFAVASTFCISAQADQSQEKVNKTAQQVSKDQAAAKEKQQKHNKAAKQYKKTQKQTKKQTQKQSQKNAKKEKKASSKKSTSDKKYRTENGTKPMKTQRDATQQKKPWWKFWQRSNTK